jgi:hypothetical protein
MSNNDTGDDFRRLMASQPMIPALALGAFSAALCSSPAILHANPLAYLARFMGSDAGPTWIAVQLAFSGPGLFFGLAFAALLASRRISGALIWVGIPLAAMVTWLVAFNIGMNLIRPGDITANAWHYWAGPLCGGVGGIMMALLASAMVPALRSGPFILGSLVVGTIAGLVPVAWVQFPNFHWSWLALYAIWQCGVLMLAAIALKRA